ncbi:N-acetylmuramoyl-L-alanine amidase [Planctomycetaceae bacterium]|nr:N-acetylmuramoyl-L-alanine amidase [Planctomycetaceae bacterium]
MFLACAGAANAGAPRKAVVTNIKHWSNPTYTRIVIELNRKTEFSHRLLKKDPLINMEWRRLYIDLAGTVMSSRLSKEIPINDGLLKAARAGQYDPATVRVVLDIESIEDFKIFPLSDPYRIVIDVTGEKKAAGAVQPIRDNSGKEVPQIRQTPAAAVPPDTSLIQQLGLKVNTIVLDPGHGGKDPGAIGKNGLKEKDVTLKLARMLRERLTRDAGAKIILTRDSDVFIPLEERTAIANSQDADLFVSIHINASPRRTASGIETYILSLSNNEEARRVAARENATSTRSVSDLEFILSDLIKTAKTNDSARLAAVVQDNLVNGLKKKFDSIRSNGVKGAPFYVLVGTKMPSVLVEVSFISNPDEEERLKDETYLSEVVEGIAAGVMNYMNGAGAV